MTTEAQRAARRANGRLGGRPRKNAGSAAIQRARQLARAVGEASVLTTVRFLVAVRDGLVPGADVSDRVKAADSLLDRFGFPKLSQQQHMGELPVKLYDLTPYDAPTERAAAPDVPPEQAH